MTPTKPTVSIRRTKLALFALPLILLLTTACGTQLPLDSAGTGLRGESLNPNAPASPNSPTPQSSDTTAAARAIEEADVIKIQDNLVYAFNQFKGLFIIDVTNPDAPVIIGRLELKGAPVEMYIVGPRAYIVASSNYYYPYADIGVVNAFNAPGSDAFAPPAFDGSKVTVVDVGDPTAPKPMGDIRLVGYATASRRVGDVIYVIGSDINQSAIPLKAAGDDLLPPGLPNPDYLPRSFVASINVSDPNDIKPLERKTFLGSASTLHVSESALFAASSDYGYDPTALTQNDVNPFTRVQYVDISDPAGTIKLRGTTNVPGLIRNRFYMDDFEGVLRVATESAGFGFQRVNLYTYDLADPDNIKALGNTEIIRGESLEAVRFDGNRGYLVTFLRKDPLFVVDLADATKPVVAGRLEVPGFSTHIEPRGDRLIAVGIDDTQGQRPAVALYDVSDVNNPKQLSRITLGPAGQYVSSSATYDEKAFKIIEDLGLIAIPFTYYRAVDIQVRSDGTVPPDVAVAIVPGYAQSGCVAAVQLIDYAKESLTQRGAFEHRGNVERVGAIGTRIFAMSQQGFQTVNIDDRDKPVALAFLPFIDADQINYFDGCGGYIGVPFDGIDGGFNPFDLLNLLASIDPATIQRLLNALAGDPNLCGAMSVPALAGFAGFAGFVGMRNVRRRRR